MSTAKAGTLICVDSGCYSDYMVVGFFVVLQDFDPISERDEYIASHPEENHDYGFNGQGVLAQTLAKGLLLEIQYGTIHLDDYGTPSEFMFTPLKA